MPSPSTTSAASAAANTGNNARFQVEALREIAGENTFVRGAQYYRNGKVSILSVEPGRVLAQVAGTEDYRTVLTGRGRKIDGECSCPAFEERGFCKHMVATALAANDVGAGAEEEGAGALPRIRDYLKKKGVDAVVEMIIDMAERDGELFRRLDLAAAVVDVDDKTLEARVRKAIDAATRTAHFIGYEEAAGWAKGVSSVLDTIGELADGARAPLALQLVARALDRIGGAMEHIDDSDGHCGGLLERAAEIHLAAARAARPDPVALARQLFEREVNGGWDTFTGAAERYAEVLGDAGLAEYRRLAENAWAKLPVRAANARTSEGANANYGELVRILDVFAERDGDVEARIALRSKDLSSSWDYFRLAQFCREQGREEEALRRAEEGLWLFDEGDPDEQLLLLAVDLLVKAGRNKDADARLWRAFQKAPSRKLYEQLRELGGSAAAEQALAFLEARLGKPPQWLHRNLLIGILTDEKMFERAWQVVRKHDVSPDLRQALATASEATHPREAVEAYIESVDRLIAVGTYEEAVQLIARMAKLRDASEQKAYVVALKERHARKRNLMKLLA